MIGKYIWAVIAAFLSSIVAVFIQIPFWFYLDNIPDWGRFLAACLVGFSTALVGVVSGTIALPRSEWNGGSKRLWIAGTIFSILPLFLTLFLLPGLFLGGFVAWQIFRWLDRKSDEVGLNRKLSMVIVSVVGIFICSIVTLKFLGGLNAMTKEKAIQLVSEAGGFAVVERESAAIFLQVKTNNDGSYSFYAERTNFPALFKLGRWVTYEEGQGALPESVLVRYGGHFHGGLYWIYPGNFDASKLTAEGRAKFQQLVSHGFQLTNNILVVEFSH